MTKVETFTAHCELPGCGNTAQTRLDGVMPKNWFGRYDASTKKMHRYCSEKCLAASRPKR